MANVHSSMNEDIFSSFYENDVESDKIPRMFAQFSNRDSSEWVAR